MKAMIFSAGLGTRFKPWTDHHPKPLAIVNGKSLLQRNVEYLQQFGITEVVVNVHHFSDQIVEAVSAANGWGSQISISDERAELLETGGGLMKARPYLDNGEAFVTLNADILTNLDLNHLLAYHRRHHPVISFGVTQRESSRYFLFNDENRLCGWRNQETGKERIVIASNNLRPMAYSCVVIFEPEIFAYIRHRGKFSLVETYLDLAGEHLILGYDHTGDRIVDVGQPGSIALAESLFA